MLLKIIIDGWDYSYRGFKIAETPNLNKILNEYPYSILKSYGEFVGLHRDMQGTKNSGLLTLGCGRVINRSDIQIDKSISNRSFYSNPVLVGFVSCVKSQRFHIITSLRKSGKIEHIKSLLVTLKKFKKKDLFLHVILEDDQENPRCAEKDIIKLTEILEKSRTGSIATVSGSYYGFDVEQRWERTLVAYNALVKGAGLKAKNVFEAVRSGYKRNENDKFIKPTVIVNSNLEPLCKIGDGDGIIWTSFDSLKIIQLVRALRERDFAGFRRNIVVETDALSFCQLPAEVRVATMFPEKNLKFTLTETLSDAGTRQVKISEALEMSEFIYYFNGKSERLFFNEDRIEVPSPDTPSFTSTPEMSSYLITDKCLEIINQGMKQFILINFINFGVMQKLGMVENQIKALEVIDQCIGSLYNAIDKKKDIMVITAQYPSLVPFIVIKKGKYRLRKKGKLTDATVTTLNLMKIDKPKIMKGKNLLI